VFRQRLRTLLSNLPHSLSSGESAVIWLRIWNHGERPAVGQVRVMGPDTVQGIGAPSIASGGSALVEAVLNPMPGRRVSYIAEVVLPDDEDPTNDRAAVEVVYGAERSAVVLAEMMVAPAPGGQEWVEVQNLSSHAVDLDGWGLRDASGRTGRVQMASALGPMERRVLAKTGLTGTPTAIVTPWPTLNDGGDSVVLLGAVDSEIDVATYEASRPGRSLERIDLGREGDPSNWLPSTATQGATPGHPNSVAHEPSVNLRVDVSPSPFVETTVVTVTLESRRARLILRVFDRVGRLRRTLSAGSEVGSRFTAVWDGRDDRGRRVKPGPFVVDVEAVTADGSRQRTRTTVVYGMGLGLSP